MKQNNFFRCLCKIVESHIFEGIILFVIILNTVVLGFETSASMMSKYGGILLAIDDICLYIFIAELILKLVAYNKGFFKNGWNFFDFIVVALSLVSKLPYITILRVFRVFRIVKTVRAVRVVKTLKVARSLRLISGLNSLRTVFKAIFLSIPGIIWTVLLLLLIYYIYAIIGVELFRDVLPEKFGSIASTMFTLFQLMTFESWSESIARPIMQVYGFAWIYFISFILISAFTIMNVVVGIVVDSISTVARDDRKERLIEKTESLGEEIIKLEDQLKKIKDTLI